MKKNVSNVKKFIYLALTFFLTYQLTFGDIIVYEGALQTNGQNIQGVQNLKLAFFKRNSNNELENNANFSKEILFSNQGDFVFILTQNDILQNAVALGEATTFQFARLTPEGITTAETDPQEILIAQKAHFSNIANLANELTESYESLFLKRDSNGVYTVTNNHTLNLSQAGIQIQKKTNTEIEEVLIKSINGSNFIIDENNMLSVQNVTTVETATTAETANQLESNYEETFLRSSQDDIFGQDPNGNNLNKTLTIAQGSHLLIDGTLQLKNNADTPATYDIQNLNASHFDMNTNTLQIADDAINSDKIADTSITNDHIANNANISLSKIVSNNLLVKDATNTFSLAAGDILNIPNTATLNIQGTIEGKLKLRSNESTPLEIDLNDITSALTIQNSDNTIYLHEAMKLKFSQSDSFQYLTINGAGNSQDYQNNPNPFFSLVTFRHLFSPLSFGELVFSVDPTELYLNHKGITLMQRNNDTDTLLPAMLSARNTSTASPENNYKLLEFTHLSDSFESTVLKSSYDDNQDSLNWKELNVNSMKSEKSLQTADIDATNSTLAIKGLDENDPNRYTVSALQIIHLINHLEGYVPLLYLPEGSTTVSYTLQNGQTFAESSGNGFSISGSTVTFTKPAGSTNKIFTTTATINTNQVDITVVIP